MLTDFLEKYGVEWSKTDKHSRHSWVQARPCPRCGNERFHLGIKDDGSRAACYTCGGWSVPLLLRQLTNAPYDEIRKLLGNRAYLPKELKLDTGGVFIPPTMLRSIIEVPAVHQYSTGRGFDPDYLEATWGCRATGPFSNYPFRLYIPVYLGKKAVSWVARAACGQHPRYCNAQSNEKLMDEKKLLLGQQYVRDSCIVVEGPTDLFRIGKGGVATLGLAYTQHQVDLLSSIWRRVICFDNSDNAQSKARKLADDLSVFPGETIVVNLDAEDPGSATQHEIDQLRKLAGL